jgi:hypothetical protein
MVRNNSQLNTSTLHFCPGASRSRCADVNAVAADGSTAIMFARKADPVDLEILELLCSHNADVTIKDGCGRNIDLLLAPQRRPR